MSGIVRQCLNRFFPTSAVARPEEGFTLREAGFPGPVLVLGLWPLEQAGEVVRAGLECVVAQKEAVAPLAAS